MFSSYDWLVVRRVEGSFSYFNPFLTLMNYLYDVCFWHFLYGQEGRKIWRQFWCVKRSLKWFNFYFLDKFSALGEMTQKMKFIMMENFQTFLFPIILFRQYKLLNFVCSLLEDNRVFFMSFGVHWTYENTNELYYRNYLDKSH